MPIVADRNRNAEREAISAPPVINDAARGEHRLRAIVPFVFVLAVLLAPLLASFVRIEAGLLVMGVALAGTAMLLRVSIGEMPARYRQPLGILLALNCLLAVACFAAAIVRLTAG